MVVLKDTMTAEEHGAIDAHYQELYTERDGKFEISGIQGVKSGADVARVTTALEKERTDHKATKGKLNIWGDLDHEDVVGKLDRMPELEAAANGKLDDAAIDEIVTKRFDAKIRATIAPLERQVATLTTERDGFAAENDGFRTTERRRRIGDAIGAVLAEAKVVESARLDAVMLAQGHFEITEDGAIITREGVPGISAGNDPKGWLTELQPTRGHWWPGSSGGGARGSDGNASAFGGVNPWAAKTWNMTKQGQFLKAHGPERAEQAARAAGTTIGGKPAAAKA